MPAMYQVSSTAQYNFPFYYNPTDIYNQHAPVCKEHPHYNQRVCASKVKMKQGDDQIKCLVHLCQMIQSYLIYIFISQHIVNKTPTSAGSTREIADHFV